MVKYVEVFVEYNCPTLLPLFLRYIELYVPAVFNIKWLSLPKISNFPVGLVVPIPTLLPVIVITTLPLVDNCKARFPVEATTAAYGDEPPVIPPPELFSTPNLAVFVVFETSINV